MGMDKDYDVVVVGAGPAGSTTARCAAENGAKVIILEKRAEVGSPVRCGEGLDKNGVAKMGIKPDKKWIANEVKGAHNYAPNGTRIELKEGMAGNEVGYVINRDIFDKELAKLAKRENRILLTRDKDLAGVKDLEALYIQSTDLDEQLIQVITRFDLEVTEAFSRCAQCNFTLIKVEKARVKNRIPEKVYERQKEFWKCQKCDKYYWQGTHFQGIKRKIEELERKTSAA